MEKCQCIINSLGYSAESHYGDKQAFNGGGCAHQTKNSWYQVMNKDEPATCEAKENQVPGQTPWQRLCACISSDNGECNTRSLRVNKDV